MLIYFGFDDIEQGLKFMVSLPQSPMLPVQYLAASFNNVTTSYKYYWFLAILEHIRVNQSTEIAINELLGSMLAFIWYPTSYFRLSFGKQDRLGQIASQIEEAEGLPISLKRQQIMEIVMKKISELTSLAGEVKSLGLYVPYRFLRPFFAEELKGIRDTIVNAKIEKLASQNFNVPEHPSLYRFIGQPINKIEIHPAWYEYLNQHMAILSGFCLWHLVNYVQKNNPNIPNVSQKLFEPEQRDLKNARAFWTIAFDKLGDLTCIYSGEIMSKRSYSLDHFLPWRYVAHDLLWNIIPAPRKINSSKSDNLPSLTHYFNAFSLLQFRALQSVAETQKNHLLEDYLLLLNVGSIDDLRSMNLDHFREALQNTIAPQFQIAENLGFTSNWRF